MPRGKPAIKKPTLAQDVATLTDRLDKLIKALASVIISGSSLTSPPSNLQQATPLFPSSNQLPPSNPPNNGAAPPAVGITNPSFASISKTCIELFTPEVRFPNKDGYHVVTFSPPDLARAEMALKVTFGMINGALDSAKFRPGSWRGLLGYKSLFLGAPSGRNYQSNTDGAKRGNPGRAGYGIMFRDYTGSVMEVPTKNIGTATSLMADCTEILAAAERAYHKGWHILLIESDSTAAVDSFNHSCMPRQLELKWRF
ncbi:hypothetical protein GIB67_014878 [Kingdonia uniflora]|uniref:RNase H type-1 domain-containing protein n=1 Tax=Kingdonia uniflora TaxID=39325 RepID=A0A7J7MTB3_9MAGN|nr:hypothetical protein GIB67_014878 [Kingdonia uniflora]